MLSFLFSSLDGYILVVDRSDTKAYIRELQAVSRNINQIAKRANATGTVYRQDIEDIKKAVDEIWRLQRRTLFTAPQAQLVDFFHVLIRSREGRKSSS